MIEMIEITKQAVFKIIGCIMWLAPIGAMGASGFTVGRFGVASLLSLGTLVAEFYLTCILFVCLVLWPIAHWNGVNLWRLMRYIRTELLIVIGTSSSESVFPQLVSKRQTLGCEEQVVGLVLPTGYAFNHDGTCLYFAAASVFLAQAVGIDLSLGQQLGLLGILLVSSKGGAGVAGSAIVVLVSTLAATGTVPVAAVGLILGVHRLLSSAFVAVNVLGNALATIVIARWEGAVDEKVLENGLNIGLA
jgi:aerobic C4-dicarboxylate transport protein